MGISEHYIHKLPVSKPVILLGYGKPDDKKDFGGAEPAGTDNSKVKMIMK